MNFRKKTVSVLILIIMMISSLYAGAMGTFTQEDLKELVNSDDKTLHIWYNDESLTDYLSCAAISYKDKTGIRVVPELVQGAEYLEQISRASVSDPDNAKKPADPEDIPDLFLVRNDSLEKAYLAGLAASAGDPASILNTEHFPETALNAVTYKDKRIGYPLSFETSVLLYNKTYLEEMAKNQILAQQAETEPTESEEASSDITDESVTQEQLRAKMEELVPTSIEDILSFADSFDAPEAVEAVFKWDVSDIFYNYFIIGNYMTVGGESGDDPEQISIYNEDTIQSLKVYQDLNQFFSIDTKEVTYDTVLTDFMDGKIVFSVVTTDAVKKLEEAKAEGTFAYDYGITRIPAISKELDTRSLSVTSAIAINGYSDKQTEAELFASYLTEEYAGQLYAKSGKPSSNLNVTYENEKMNTTMEEYAHSVSMPKMIATSNFWVQLEICFTNAWLGEDVNQLLKQLSEKIKTQINGEPFTEEPIVIPETITEEIIDEGMGN